MATLLFPSSYRCDCGHESHFFENTIWEMAEMSLKKRKYLEDSTASRHTIEFSKGHAVAVICPHLGRRAITATE